MAKPRNKAFNRLDRRIKDWNQTQNDLRKPGNKTPPTAYRKPGSMKK